MTTWSKLHPFDLTTIITKTPQLVTLFLHLLLKSISIRAERITLLKCKSYYANLLKVTLARADLKAKVRAGEMAQWLRVLQRTLIQFPAPT